MRKALLHLNHQLIQSLLTSDMTVCDMTCGHGYDTEFIAPRVKHVYSFDVQEEALVSAKQRLHTLQNVTFVHDSFVHVTQYVKNASLFIFNLGYLPQSDKTITTTKDQTIQALSTIKDYYPKASIVLMSYIGHDEGKIEYAGIQDWILKQTAYKVIQSTLLNHDDAPVMLWIYPK
ncbi:MAG: class I SAM-dependent methyltransferase [Acholeplasmataceae bacterium]